MKLSPTLERFLVAIGEGRWGTEPGNRISAAQRLKDMGLVRWVFTPYTIGAYGGTNHPELTPEGEMLLHTSRLKNASSVPDLQRGTRHLEVGKLAEITRFESGWHDFYILPRGTEVGIISWNPASETAFVQVRINGERYKANHARLVEFPSWAEKPSRANPSEGRREYVRDKYTRGRSANSSDLEPDLVPILQEVASKGRVRFHQKHYPLLHAGLIEYASAQRRRFAYVQVTDAGLDMNARIANPEKLEMTVDQLMDITADVCPSTSRRDQQMLAAHRAQLKACEVCGKGIKKPETATLVVDSETGEQVSILGPECAKKVKKVLRQENPSVAKLKREVSR